MSFLVVWRLLPLLGLLHFSVLAELNYHDPSRGAAPFVFTDTSPEYGLGENAIADSWDIHPPQYGFGDSIVADSRGEATDGTNFLQLNTAIPPPSDQAQSPESPWLSVSLDCSPANNPTPNQKRRARRQSDSFCPVPEGTYEYNQIAPGREAGTQPAPRVVPPVILRQDRKPKPSSAPKPKPILKGDPVNANEWVCDHPTVNYPVCADFEHATEKPFGSGSYDLLMAKLYDPAHCEAPDILWCCGRVDKRTDENIGSIDHLKAVDYPLVGYKCAPQQSTTGKSTDNPSGGAGEAST